MLTALLAVAIGSTIISGMITIYREVPEQLGREFRAYGANLLLLPKNDSANFKETDLDEVGKLLSDTEIVGIAPFIYERLEINKQYILTGGADFQQLTKVSPYWQVQGDYPKVGEREIIVGANLAKIFSPYDTADLIGKTVSVSAGEGTAMRQYTVTGIVSTGGKEEDFAFMNLADVQKIVDKPHLISLAQVSIVADSNSLKNIVAAIEKNLPEIQPQPVRQIANSEFNVLGKLEILIFLVSIIVLVLTLICVSTTMMAVVTERRKEIGLHKALGASNKNIVLEFLGEGCLLGVFGGVLGSVLGYIFAESISMQVFSRGISFSISIAILSILLSIAVTGVASLIPVRIATNVDPAIVLRGE